MSILTQDGAIKLLESAEQFPVDFDDGWQWLGYATKQKAKQKLVKHFDEGIDFIINQTVVMAQNRTSGSGRQSEQIQLTIDCFKSLGMMSGTTKGKEVRQHFLECEKKWKLVQQRHPEIAQDIELERLKMTSNVLDKQNAILDKELQLRRIDNNMLTLHGAPVILALRGKEDQVVEVEKVVLEVIDNGVTYKGKTLVQIRDDLAANYGIVFKNGADIKRYLEKEGEQGLIGQTPRKVLSDYIPEENLNEVYQVLRKRDRQLLLGE